MSLYQRGGPRPLGRGRGGRGQRTVRCGPALLCPRLIPDWSGSSAAAGRGLRPPGARHFRRAGLLAGGGRAGRAAAAGGAQGCGVGPPRGQRWRGLRGPAGLSPEPAAQPRPGQPPPLQPRPGPSPPRAAEAGESLPGPATSLLGVGPRRGTPHSCLFASFPAFACAWGGPRSR